MGAKLENTSFVYFVPFVFNGFKKKDALPNGRRSCKKGITAKVELEPENCIIKLKLRVENVQKLEDL